MKLHILCLGVFALLSSCITEQILKGYEEGGLISRRNNVRTQALEPEVIVKINKVSINGAPALEMAIYRYDVRRELSEDVYSKLAVYDVQSYNILFGTRDHYQRKEITSDKIVKPSDQVLKNEKEFTNGLRIVLDIDGTKIESEFKDNVAYFPLNRLKLDFKASFKVDVASVKIGEETFSIKSELIDFMDNEYRSLHPEKFYKGAQFLIYKHKMEFCESPDVLGLMLMGQSKYEKNCMLIIDRRFKVLQSSRLGALLQPASLPYDMPQQIIFLKNSKRFADDAQVDNLLAEYVGLHSYTTVMGAEKTVHAFKYLGGIKMTYQNTGSGGWSIDADQE